MTTPPESLNGRPLRGFMQGAGAAGPSRVTRRRPGLSEGLLGRNLKDRASARADFFVLFAPPHREIYQHEAAPATHDLFVVVIWHQDPP